MERDVVSYCRICAAACGITVTVDGDQVVRVRGDADHPVSRGYTCSKGRGLAEWHAGDTRLDRPRVRGTDVEWPVLLDDLAATLSGTIDAHGAEAVALYLATGMAYDAAGQVAAVSWLASIGSHAFYTAATVDNAPVLVAAELVTGHALLSPVWDVDAHGLLVVVGSNPVVSHGYGTAIPDPVRHLRDHRAGGGRLWVIDPRRTETAALADVHLAVRPGADVAVLAAVASALLTEGADPVEMSEYCTTGDLGALREALAPFTVERAALAAEVESRALHQLIAEVRAHRGRLAVLCGTGTTMAPDGVLVEWLRWVLLILTGSLDRPGGMRFQDGPLGRLRPPRGDHAKGGGGAPQPGPTSRPELTRVVGQMPAVALADEIEAGHVRALVVTGGNPIGALPQPDRMRAALATLDALVVVDVAESELTALATHVLPATGQLERADLLLAANLSVRSGAQATRPVVAPVADRRPVWWMLGSVARRMGGDVLGGADPDALTDEQYLKGLMARSSLDAEAVFEAGSRGVDVPPDYGWVHTTMVPGGRWHIAPTILLERLAAHALVLRPAPPNGSADPTARQLVLIPRREVAWSNSVRYAGSGSEPVVRVHRGDGEHTGLEDGDRVEVTSSHGRMIATATIDPHARPGVVSITHSRAAPGPAWLTSTTVGVDPLTGMPHASGLPITLTRLKP